eukprot:TRINITY_DN2362_c0_g1_i2.p1 TRINITY_DN2362_c0_g1~~TRINITY_DN2362_c0_g1_i2.p1  ORF type:complete len:114 (-),score=25.79 TRINITY_DN2362_c0_g1_i2:140-481(-)
MSGDVEAVDPNEVKKELVRALLLARNATEADVACKYDVCVKYYDEAHSVLRNLLEGSSLIYLLSDNERELLTEKNLSYHSRSQLIKDAILVVEASHNKDLAVQSFDCCVCLFD